MIFRLEYFQPNPPNGHGKYAAPDDNPAMLVSLIPTLSQRARGKHIAVRFSRYRLSIQKNLQKPA